MQITRDIHQGLEKRLQPQQVRTTQVLSLLSGEAHGLVSEQYRQFDERVSFGPALSRSQSDPAKWLAQAIEQIAAYIDRRAHTQRPIIIPAPLTALAHSNTGLAADAAIRRANICHQEVCLEFGDAAFAGEPADVIMRVASLKRKGFRVGIDMRKSWTSPLSDGLRLLLDTIRVDAALIDTNPDLQELLTASRHAGVFVIAENARWRDGEYLERLGVLGATNPVADS